MLLLDLSFLYWVLVPFCLLVLYKLSVLYVVISLCLLMDSQGELSLYCAMLSLDRSFLSGVLVAFCLLVLYKIPVLYVVISLSLLMD